MDIQEIWDAIPITQSSLSKNEIMEILKNESRSDIAMLAHRLKVKLLWVLFFITLFCIGAFSFANSPALSQLFLGATFFYLVGLVAMGTQYVGLSELGNRGYNTLAYAKKATHYIRRALLIENVWGVIVLPIFMVGGLLFHDLRNGASWAEVLSDHSRLLNYVIIALIAVPVIFWITNKMNKSAFGGFLNRMDQHIHDMESLA